MTTWTVLAYMVFAVVLVVWADRWDGRRFPCGCRAPTEEDGPCVVECPCGVTYTYQIEHDWRGRVMDAWEAIDEGDSDE